jgi:tetratricopeptide (TPR) repeat protein
MDKLFHLWHSKIAMQKHSSECLLYFLSIFSMSACSNLIDTSKVQANLTESSIKFFKEQANLTNLATSPKEFSERNPQVAEAASLNAKDPHGSASLNVMSSLLTLESNYTDKITEAINNMEKSSRSEAQNKGEVTLSDSAASEKERSKSKVVSESIAIGLNNLANLYSAQGNYKQAEPLYERALSILEQAFGPNHVSLLPTLDGYGLLLEKTNKTTKSAQIMARAAAIRRNHLQTILKKVR